MYTKINMTNNLDFQIISEQDKDKFNAFIAAFPTGDLMQSYEWGELKAKSGWKPIRVMARRGDQVVAAASLLRRDIPRTGRCIIYAPRGPVWDSSDSELTQQFMAHLRELSVKQHAILLKIDPPVLIEQQTDEQNMRAAGFIHHNASGFGGTQPKCVMQLDLDKPEDELLASFKEKWRYNIRLAARKGVVVDTNCTRDQLPVFYELLKETCARDGFLVRSLSYFEQMWDLLVPAGMMKMALTFYQDKPLSGALAYIFGDRAMYTYGASSNEHRNMMPNHLMQWELIKWAQQSGCKWYDFRGVSPKKGAGDAHLEGLNRFKEGFNPRFVEYIGEYDMVLSPSWYWVWNVGMPKVRNILKRRAQKHQE